MKIEQLLPIGCRGTSSKTRIETWQVVLVIIQYQLVAEGLPVKQGLKHELAEIVLPLVISCRGTSSKTRIETSWRQLQKCIHIAVAEGLPVKQGLKHEDIRQGDIKADSVAEGLPVKQGLKHRKSPHSAYSAGGVAEGLPVKQVSMVKLNYPISGKKIPHLFTNFLL